MFQSNLQIIQTTMLFYITCYNNSGTLTIVCHIKIAVTFQLSFVNIWRFIETTFQSKLTYYKNDS